MARKTLQSSSSHVENRRGKIKSDFPKHTLEEALRIPRAIEEANGGQPLPPTETAIALGMSPGSSEFRILLSSSIKYGLTRGSFNQERVSLEEFGRSIVEPKNPREAQRALIAAALNPETFRAIHNYFRGKKLPEAGFLQNTLVREFNVPREHSEKCVGIFNSNMEHVGLVRLASTGRWLSSEGIPMEDNDDIGDESIYSQPEDDIVPAARIVMPLNTPTPAPPNETNTKRQKRVYITHGKNTAFIDPIKKLLTFGELEAVVSTEKQTVAQPVPDKVLTDMRTCGAGIIHVDQELKLIDLSTQEHVVLNPNVLIEIGAALALYGRRLILLVKDGIKLPSNLQGLFEVRYTGDQLDGTATIKLLEAINDIKNHPLP